jgi:hypothetical protein
LVKGETGIAARELKERKDTKRASPICGSPFLDRFAPPLPFTFHLSLFTVPHFASIRVHSRLQFPSEVVGGDVHSVSQVEAVGFETLDTGVED